MNEQKQQIKLALEVLDLKDIDNKVLVVKFDNKTSTQEDVVALQEVFSGVLKDMNKKLRVIFFANQYGVNICKDCPKVGQLYGTDQELIQGKPKV